MAAHPALDPDPYQRALERLERGDRRLAMAAAVVQIMHPDAADVARALLSYAEHRYPGRDVVAIYMDRAGALAAMQERFDADPRVETLGAPGTTIDRDAYKLALLLSIPFTNHRFEIMRHLDAFLRALTAPSGRIASIGTGTGYELQKMASLPEGWQIESYDIDETVQVEARRFLEFFGVSRPILWGRAFPLASPPPDARARYDALALCEVLEHLPDPATALAAVRECLRPAGRAFVTMAINIAQEDHIYLYPDVASCREQIGAAGLGIVSESLTPQTTVPPADNREAGFRKGNYVAVVAPPGRTA